MVLVLHYTTLVETFLYWHMWVIMRAEPSTRDTILKSPDDESLSMAHGKTCSPRDVEIFARFVNMMMMKKKKSSTLAIHNLKNSQPSGFRWLTLSFILLS